MAEEKECRRNGDFGFEFGPFKFRGRGLPLLAYGMVALIGAGFAWGFIHHMQSESVQQSLVEMGKGQRLMACLISMDQHNRESQLDNPNSKCNRFANGGF